MVLFWFILGIALIFCIARYNESNKLFWSLFIAYVGAFTVATVVLSTKNREPKKVNLTQAYPTQLYASAPNLFGLSDDVSCSTTNEQTRSDAVSQDYTPVLCKIYSGEVHKFLTSYNENPLQCIHISTHLDAKRQFL